MQQDPFEKQLYNNIKGYQSALDLDEAWTALEGKRKKRRRYPLWWIWGLGILCLFGLGIATAMYWQKTPTKRTITTINSTLQESNATTSPVPNLPSSSPNEVSRAEKLNPFNNKPVNNGVLENRNKIATASNTASVSSIFQKKSLRHSRQQPKSIHQEVSSIRSKNIDPATSYNTISSAVLPTPLSVQKASIASKTSTRKVINNELPTGNSLALALSVGGLAPTKKLAALPFLLVEERTLFPVRIPETPLPSKSFAKNALSWSAGYAESFRLLKATSEQQASYINARNANETPYDVWQLNFSYKRYFTKYCFVETGLSYQHWFNQFQFQQSRAVDEWESNRLVQINEYQNGDRELVRNQVLVSNIYNVQVKAWQQQAVWQIPLNIGLEWKCKPQWGMRASAGLSYAFQYQQNGLVLQPEDDRAPFLVRGFKNISQHTQGFWQAQFNGQLFYEFEPNWQFFGGIQATMDLNSRIKTTANYNLRHQSLGGKIGLSYLF